MIQPVRLTLLEVVRSRTLPIRTVREVFYAPDGSRRPPAAGRGEQFENRPDVFRGRCGTESELGPSSEFDAA